MEVTFDTIKESMLWVIVGVWTINGLLFTAWITKLLLKAVFG